MTCKHRKTWLIAGAFIEWCYECGAFREMSQIDDTAYTPYGPWCKPVGAGGENPSDEYDRRTKIYRKRYKGEK